jgi:hypothetical protein
MNAEIDHDLTLDQWEALKALRTPPAKRRALNRFVVKQLIARRLAAETGEGPAITSEGRSVLLRGSPRLWDVAARRAPLPAGERSKPERSEGFG